jgi:UDP-N-acetylmuramoyl-L-alanyl-D-glutamate--2,6-diaminopimelate ligase
MKLSHYLKDISENIISISNFADVEIDYITNDSRKVVSNTLFVAIKGTSLNGHEYIENAISSGACVVVYKDRPKVFLDKVVYIEVDDAYYVYALAAETYFQFPAENIKIIGITGTNGKTTCAFLISHILNYVGFKTGLISTVHYSYENKIVPALRTTPEPFELQSLLSEMNSAGCKYVVMEVSSHSLIQSRLGRTKLAAALFTNLSGEHLDYHGDMKNYYLAKKRLFEMYSPGSDAETLKVINIDDFYGGNLISELSVKRLVTYGSGKNSDFGFLCDNTGTITDLFIANKRYNVETSLIGRFNAYNITGSVALCLELGISADMIIEALKCFSSVPGRLEVLYTSNNARCYVDYAHTDDALKRALTALKGLNPSRLIVVFGCGGDRDKIKRPRMGKIASELADIIIITDDNPRTENSLDIINDIILGIPQAELISKSFSHISDLNRKIETINYEFAKSANLNKQFKIIPDREEAISYAVGLAEKNDVILIAGKGHEDYQEIGTKRYPFDDRKVVKSLNLKES